MDKEYILEMLDHPRVKIISRSEDCLSVNYSDCGGYGYIMYKADGQWQLKMPGNVWVYFHHFQRDGNQLYFVDDKANLVAIQQL